MAQIELRFLTDFDTDKKRLLADISKYIVNIVHYGKVDLEPGDVSLFVPVLDTELSDSDAEYELEISEGSDNWPKDARTGLYLAPDLAKDALEDRARIISGTLRKTFAAHAHNIFEVNGIATGWVQYKPGQE
ncbi:MAG TPA: hypothetical protein VMR76_02100 [Candidatus Saccharimonadia bacterium]|nr:hypothetical protein [Candidatus Saccharimonadia bacterium]